MSGVKITTCVPEVVERINLIQEKCQF